MKFKESSGWSEHEDWGRWYYEAQKELYDLSKMFDDNKVYIFSYSFRSDIDVNSLGVNFFNTDSGWKMITNWTYMIGNVKKYTKYSGKIVIIPRTNAAGCNPKNTYMNFDMGNRNVSVPATLSFYEFKLEQIPKEPVGIETWTISGKVFKISEPEKTFAEILPSFEGKNNVLHIKPAYSAYGINYYSDPVIQYDLSESGFAGEKIAIEMSMNVYLKKNARIAWQINSQDPYYPVICGTVPPDDRFPDHSDPAPLPANEWKRREHIPDKNTAVIPSSGDKGKLLYLSGQQIEGAEAYFANAEISINKITPNVIFNSVTANGSPSEPKNTTQLTLNFNQAIAGLKEDDITISGVDGVIKRRLKPIDSVSGAYTLDISGFTSTGTLTVTVKKDGYNISGSPTVTIYYYPTVNFNNVTADGSTWEPKTTTELTLEFSEEIPGLNASNIDISGVSGIIKGNLSREGSTYTLPISGFTASGTLTVTVTRPDCIINNSPRTVNIIYSAFDSAVGLKGLTIHNINITITVDTNTGIITKEINSDWGNWFSVAIPGNLTITTNDIIVVKYIGFGDAQLMPKLPYTYDDVKDQDYPVFTGNQTEQTFEIDASRYEVKMPNTPNAVLTFQGMKNNPVAWKLKIISITVRHN